MIIYNYFWRKPIEITNDESIKDLFITSRITMGLLNRNMIENLLRSGQVIGEGATAKAYKVNNYMAGRGFLTLKVIQNAFLNSTCTANQSRASPQNAWGEEEDENEVVQGQEDQEEPQLDFNKIRSIYNEWEILHRINHPNIIKAYAFYYGDQTIPPSILLEYCRYTLSNSINLLEKIDLVGVIYEICIAMKFMHEEKRLIHRDLKPSNIMINLKKHVKIGDFGTVKLISTTTSTSMTHGVGTALFMAPELWNESVRYDYKVDVYAFGVVMFFVLTNGRLPAFDRNGRLEGAQIPRGVNSLSASLIRQCWSFDPANRPSFSEIIQVINNNNFQLVDGIEDQIPALRQHLGIQ